MYCCCCLSLTCTHYCLFLWVQFIKIPGFLQLDLLIMVDYYQVLGVRRDVSADDIKKAWVHPLLFSSTLCLLYLLLPFFRSDWLAADIISPSLTCSSHITQSGQIVSHTSQTVTLPYYFKITSYTWTWWPTSSYLNIYCCFYGWERRAAASCFKSLCYWNTPTHHQSQVWPHAPDWMLFLPFSWLSTLQFVTQGIKAVNERIWNMDSTKKCETTPTSFILEMI